MAHLQPLCVLFDNAIKHIHSSHNNTYQLIKSKHAISGIPLVLGDTHIKVCLSALFPTSKVILL